MQQFFQEHQTRIHHAAPSIVPRGVFSFLANCMANPLLELRLGEIVVINPPLITRVVWRVNIDALDPASVGGKQRFEGDEVVPFDDEVAVEPGLLALS